ncbi:MAG: urease accessory protein, partial [Deltaproteobacteria bacterium]|nr:urease accessory protein [Deltaproteobacteria bacterium]
MIGSAGGVALGFAIGLRHALEPDHLTAVSTLVVDARGAQRGALLGALWGVGHTLALLAVGSVLLATSSTLPDRAADMLELAVAAMLVVLGIRSLARAVHDGERGPVHGHRHGATAHAH